MKPTHSVVASFPNVFCGWPANGGLWAWGEELRCRFDVSAWRQGPAGHHHCYPDLWPGQAASEDGGATWHAEPGPEPWLRRVSPSGRSLFRLPSLSRKPSAYAMASARPPMECRFGADAALCFGRLANSGGFSWLSASEDRGRTWPHCELVGEVAGLEGRGVMARTDLVQFPGAVLLAQLTFAKGNCRRGEGVPWCVEVGLSGRWEARGQMWAPSLGPGEYAIMPSTVHCGGALVSALRVKVLAGCSVEVVRSLDCGRTWSHIGTATQSPVQGQGNPGALVALGDGRLALAYGVREPVAGIRGKVSGDGGESWGPEQVLAELPSWDCGYCRSVARADGRVATVYYANRPAERRSNIECTVWEP